MCRQSSSADPTLPRDPGDYIPSHLALPGAEQFILHHAALLGPCAAWFIRTLWGQAAQQAYQDSVQLLSHAYRYTPQRLERACRLALLYNLDSLHALRLIFAEDLDRLPMRPDAELTGQLLLPFPKVPS
jgi:hypothetical protein